MLTFCDMDGVIADLVLGLERLVGKDPVTPGTWDIDFNFESLAASWWADLPKMREADRLIGMSDYILTVCASGEAFDGKKRWIRKRYPRLESKMICLTGTEKHILANGNRLFDDRPSTIVDWRKHGGIGILVPRRWNNPDLADISTFDFLMQ